MPSRHRSSMVSLRLSPEELDRLRGMAERRGVSVSRLVRDALLGRCPAETRYSVTAGQPVSVMVPLAITA